MRVQMWPNSMSPWADWLRFMKSMSMVSQGISALYWVWKWRSGFCNACRPFIHIFAGEKVCIQVMMPIHFSSLLAAFITCSTSFELLAVPL